MHRCDCRRHLVDINSRTFLSSKNFSNEIIILYYISSFQFSKTIFQMKLFMLIVGLEAAPRYSGTYIMYEDGWATLMLVTMLCWWLYDGEVLKCRWQNHYISDSFTVYNWSPTSQTAINLYRGIPRQTPVIKIDIVPQVS